jgi:hypothetical protein
MEIKAKKAKQYEVRPSFVVDILYMNEHQLILIYSPQPIEISVVSFGTETIAKK